MPHGSLALCAALALLGDQEGQFVPLHDARDDSAEGRGAAEGGGGVAIVGNGPLSAANYADIQKAKEVYMFNDLKNLMAPTDRFTTWVVRANGEQPDKLLGVPYFSKEEGYDYHKAFRHSKRMNLGLAVLKERSRLAHLNFPDILVIAGATTIFRSIKKANPNVNVLYAAVYEEEKDSNQVPQNTSVLLGGCASYLHSTTGCGPSSGLLALDFAFAQRKDRGTKQWIHIFGMNWVFHQDFESCCNADRNFYDKPGNSYEDTCCDDCHNFYREEKLIQQCCVASNLCRIHRTPNKHYDPYQWGPRDFSVRDEAVN